MIKNSTFFSFLLSALIILTNFVKKIISLLIELVRNVSSLKFSLTLGCRNSLQLKRAFYQMVCCLILLSSATAFSQLAVPFSTRLPGGSIKVKGDIVLIGNNIITGKGLSVPYNGSGNNNSYEGVYVNEASGGDASIFSSSSADFVLNESCKSIAYAGLYWATIYPNEVGTNSGAYFQGTTRFEDWNQVKFKLPTGGFIDLVADNNADTVGEEDAIIFDGYDSSNINNSFKDSPIICYKNVTNLLQGLTEAEGTYTVANLRATRGSRIGGCAGGWTLVIIYESPTLPSKYISTFDGYAGVQGTTTLGIPVSGFQTLPAPSPVIASIGVAALEGDNGGSGDTFAFKASTSAAYTLLSDAVNPSNNFFNSRITSNGAYMTARNPNSRNTLGYDIKKVIVPNPNNNVIPNNATAGDLRLTTSGDGYGAFFASFAVDIIEPTILLTKIVEDKDGNDISGANVNLGDELNYVIGFQNIGNDNATNFTIRDILPDNVIFDRNNDIAILPTGITVQSYNATTKEIVFAIDDSVVEMNDPTLEIRFKVKVVSSCNELSDACSNSINNTAYATYAGVTDPNFTISDDPSINSNSGCIFTPQATNFLVGIDDCTFTGSEVLCGSTVELTAANGYDSYSWSTSSTGSPVIGTTQSITVSNTGTYYVRNTAVAPCLSINQEITVVPFGNVITNPVIPYADEVVECPNDGKLLPNIYLCGANASREIQTGVSDGSTLIWERLNEASCTAAFGTDCANESTTCTWTQVGTGPNYTVNSSGQFRLTLNYAGGCFNRFYFNSYQNLLSPTVSTRDIICTTLGQITVGGVPSGYEYSIDGTNYQDENIFDITTQDIYTVYVKQIGVTSNPCIFTVPDVQIRRRNFTVSTVVTNPLCNGGKGSVKLAANDVRAQYYYAVYQGGTLVNSVGPINDSDYTFPNLNPGSYTATVSTQDGCTQTVNFEIVNPAVLSATSALTTPLTCNDGVITVYPVGGTAPYTYFVNSTTDFDTDPEIIVTASGVYNITVVDKNNCSATTSVTVEAMPVPVYTISKTDVLCYNSKSGEIRFNVTNANGYSLTYSINNGTSYVSNSVFSNLSPGTYQAIMKYSVGTIECFTTAESITITQPDAALTASAGVSELSGCGPSGAGKLRITNPQGGTAPYEYSFDNQATWSTTNDAFVQPGTYTLYVRDANGCIYSMPNIVLDPEPVAPTINVGDPNYNCDGSANSTVTVTNEEVDTFTYTYLLDGVANTNTADPKTFLNVSEGEHTITVEYALSSVPTFSNLLQETFGYGEDTSSPGINSTYYCFERQVTATRCNGSIAINDGDYSVTAKIVSPFGTWLNPTDHTPATTPATANGRYLVVNIGSTIPTTAILYEKFIDNIIPNQPINVEFYAINLLKSGTQFDPDLAVALIDASGNEISSYSTGDIPKSQQWEAYPKTAITLNPGANTSLRFVLRSNVRQNNGNDVAIDDITVYQLPKSCVTQVDFPIIIGSGNAFSSQIVSGTDVSCSGGNDGTITVAAQNFDTTNGFQYSIDNGTTWATQLTSPYTITGLSQGSYDVQVRYSSAADASCTEAFTQVVGSPNPLVVNTSVTPITCLTGATIRATGTGGTQAYSYELLDTATLNLISTFPSNGVLTDVAAGNYTVRITDSKGCTATRELTLTGSTAPTATITSADYCYDSANAASLEVTATGGQTPYEYNINGGTFQTNNTFANLVPGNYVITVRDAYGCTYTLPSETIAQQLSSSIVLTKDLDCTTSPDAVIDGSITGGYAPFTYELSIDGATYTSLGSTGTPYTYSATNSGTYQFRVTDAQGCQALSNIITINPLSNPVVTANTTNVSCNGASDGSVQLTGSAGSGSYTFSNDNVTFVSTSSFTGLSTGSHTFYIKDSKNCVSSVSVTITEPSAIAALASATSFTCSTTNTKQSAVITIAVPTTGTSPYQYSFNGGTSFSSTRTLTVNDNGSNQTFSYVVKDANGCLTAAQSITLTALNPPTDLAFTASAVTCSATTSSVDLTATNGVGTLQYETISPSPIIVAKQTSNSFAGLTPGTYVFQVTDANGCYYSESYTIAPVTPIAVTGNKLSDVLCFGGTNGSGTYTVSGNATVGNYTFALTVGTLGTGTLTKSGNVLTLSNVAAGTYTVRVTDSATACFADATITITEPTNALTFTSTSTNVFCTNDESQITVSASGGTVSYTYAAVVTGATAPTVYDASNVITVDTNSAANLVWDVYVKDANGCITMDSITITADALPTVTTPTLASNQCTASTGFTFTATGTGLAPLTYSINGGTSYQTSPTFTVNTPGSYTVTIKDGKGCTATSSTPTVVYAPLSTNAVLTKDLTCSSPQDATIDVTTTGGNAPYTYKVKIGSGVYGTSVSYTGGIFTYTATTADTYQFEITDANGCSKETNVITTSATVNPEITNVVQTQFISCSGEATAAIEITIDNTKGLAPFVFTVLNTTTGQNFGTQTSGLTAGDYEVTVTDSKGCTDTFVLVNPITEPDPIILDFDVDPITCGAGGISLGNIIINSVTGGTPNYIYHVTGTNGYSQELTNQTGTTQVFEVVDFGLYEIIITDANGCTVLKQDILVASPPDDLDITIDSTADCINGGEAVVSIGSSSSITGAGPFYFAIYTGPGMVYDGSAIWELGTGSPFSATFIDLIPDVTYTFIVYDDDTKCYYYETATTAVPTNSTLSITGLTASNITCKGETDGSVSFSIISTYGVGVDTDVTYEILDSQTLATTGITGSDTILGDGTPSDINEGSLPFGNYIIVIEETSGPNAGCSIASLPFNITESAIELSVTASVTKNENCNELGVITAIGKDGTSPYTYQLLLATDAAPDNTSTSWASANTFTATADSYVVYVKDAYGCVKETPITLTRDADPTIDAVALQCFTGSPISITLSGTTSVSPATYAIGTGGVAGAYHSSATFTISAAGTYNVFIKDGNGCIATTTYVVQPALLLDADITKELDCTTSPNAEITLKPSGGTGTYATYEVNYNSGSYVVIGGSPYTATAAGTYQFRITDDQGCLVESNIITIDALTNPTFTFDQTNVSCNGGSDGSIVVTATGGIAPYQYSRDNGSTFQASNVFTGLAAGAYNVVVRDSKSCVSPATLVTITEQALVGGLGDLTQGLTCGTGNATQAATVTITGSGGTTPYTYSFDGGSNYTSTNTYSTFTAGTVTAYVKDANGCIIVTPIDVVVPALDAPTDLDFSATAVTCTNTTSDVQLTTTDGVAPLSYAILSPAASTSNLSGASTGLFTGLAPDTYIFEVTDANFCTYQESYTVIPVTNIAIAGLKLNDVYCFGDNTGAIQFTVTGYAGTYTSTLTTGTGTLVQTGDTIDLTDLVAGTYTVRVTDDVTGCFDDASIIITEPTSALDFTATATNVYCTQDESQITVTATAGTASYTYAAVIAGSTAPAASAYITNNVVTVDTNSGTELDWDVYVKDINGCITTNPVTVILDPLPTVTVPTLATNQCNLVGDTYAFTIASSGGVAPLTYSIGSGFQSSDTFTGLAPGSYFVTVKDGNGCEAISPTAITIYSPLDFTPTITTLPSCADNDGVITITPSGGSGSYSYAISPISGTIGLSGNVFSGVPSGTYTITITDINTSCTKDIDVTVIAATPVTFTTTVEDTSCNGGSDGIITVSLPSSNDNPIYTYAITAGPSTATTQNSNIFSGLAAGVYTVEVTSGRNCVASQDITVGEPNAIAVPTPAVLEYACTTDTNSSKFATITVSGTTGGNGTYTIYEFIKGSTIVQSGSNNVYTETDYLGGTYTINVYDSNGCSGTTSATITPFIRLDSLDITIDNAITCTNDEAITLSVTSTGGTPTNLQYTLADVVGSTKGGVYNQTNATGTFIGLPIGNYLATVLNNDTGCTVQKIHYVSDPDTFDLTINNVVDVTCFSDNDGSVDVTFIDRTPLPSDESGAFDYEVFNSLGNSVTTGSTVDAGPITITGLIAGTYTITASLSNSPFCTVSKNFTITAPTAALAITETHTEITCVSGNNDGSISAKATGGWPGDYEYQLELTSGSIIYPYSDVYDFEDLTAGDYIVRVIDSRGCIASVNVSLVIPTPISATVTPSTILLTCFGDKNASISVTNVMGGQGSNYTYTLNTVSPVVSSSGPQLTPVFNGLGAGTYNITIIDGYNCAFTSSNIVISEPTQVESLLVKETSQTCLTGTTLRLSATGGTGNYEYSSTSDFASVLGTFVSSTTVNVAPGTYMYYVRDANGCTANVSNQIKIDPLPTLVVNVDATNAFINCAGDNTGVIVATANGGLGNYIYTLEDASGNTIPATQLSPGRFTELFAGDYQVHVDSDDCDATSIVVSITEPSSPLIAPFTTSNVTCNGENNGSITVNASGGTGQIKYAISPQLNQFFETNIFEDLAPGTYDVIVQDELGCFIVINFTITEPDPLTLTIVSGSLLPEVCTGDMDGEFSVDLLGGTAPYSVAIDDINGTYTTGTATQTQFDFTNLEGGDKVVYVRDALNCETEWYITFPESVTINPETSVEYGCTNNISTNVVSVSVDASITDTSDLDYSLNGGTYQTSNEFINVPAGIGHYIDVRHSNGCIKRTPSFDIEQFDPLLIALEDGEINEIVTAVTGGSGTYEYTLNGQSSGSTNTFLIYSSGNYTVTVTDRFGCFASATRYFEFIDLCIPNYFTPDKVTNYEWGPGCASQYPNMKVNIFDRYGRRLAILGVNDKWDGKYQGKSLPSGDYWYTIKLNDKNYDKQVVGHFTIYR